MQLVAVGAQNAYLNGNPTITFFKVVWRRHTNFAIEAIQQTWNGSAEFGRTVVCNVNRNGDLITNSYIVVSLNAMAVNAVSWGYVRRLGHAMIDSVKIEIGGSKIDEHYGDWLNIWYELTHKVGQERGYARMIGDVADLKTMTTAAKRAYKMYIPLQFWFCRNNGLALPLIALQYHDVRITLKFRDASACVNYVGSTAPTLTTPVADSYLLIDYIFLDTEERKKFAQSTHEYLIEQLQFTGSETLTSASNRYRLNFNHPSKYIIWSPHLERYITRTTYVAYAEDGDWDKAKDRFAKIMAIACSPGLSNDTAATEVTFSAITDAVYVNAASAAAGDIIEPTYATQGGFTTAMLAKVEVKFSTLTATTTEHVEIGTSLADALDNAIVIRNDLTMEDISNTVALLQSGADTIPSDLIGYYAISVLDYFNYGNFIDGTDNPVYNAKLQINGQDRFYQRDGYYFNYVQPWQYFSNTPADGINVYSFALKPEDHQPSGTCNFSRIDNTTLLVDMGLYNTSSTTYSAAYIGTASNSLINIYDVDYNILRVMSGMAGPAFSN